MRTKFSKRILIYGHFSSYSLFSTPFESGKQFGIHPFLFFFGNKKSSFDAREKKIKLLLCFFSVSYIMNKVEQRLESRQKIGIVQDKA